MKFMTLTLDRRGIVHLDFTRAPDLLRRDYAERYGTAKILFCCICQNEMCRKEISAAFARCFADRKKRSGFEVYPNEAIVAAVWLGQIKPFLLRRLHGWRRLTVKPAKTIIFRTWRRAKTLKHRYEALK